MAPARSLSVATVQIDVTRTSAVDSVGVTLASDSVLARLIGAALGSGRDFAQAGFRIARDVTTQQAFIQFRPSLEPSLGGVPGTAGDITLARSSGGASRDSTQLSLVSEPASECVAAVLANGPALAQAAALALQPPTPFDRASVVQAFQTARTRLGIFEAASGILPRPGTAPAKRLRGAQQSEWANWSGPRRGGCKHICGFPAMGGKVSGRTRHRWGNAVLAALALITVMSGCVSLELPTFAHVHVGHAMTAWADTPGQKGLFEVALQDSKIAAEHADFAVAGARDIASIKLHLGHVLHAVDPSLEANGPGSGYGLGKALAGSVEHLAFAQEVRDASPNLKAGLPGVIEALQPLRRDAQLLAVLARDARQTDDTAQVVAYAQEVKVRSDRLAMRVSDAYRRLGTLLAAENPPYRPVARRYLFGVIRLPSGEWSFAPGSVQRTPGGYRY